MERSSGVLLHITSLPGKGGIGKFGAEAVRFAEFLKNAGFTYWQVLPFTPVGEGDSPYMAYSAFAGYIALIDPQGLVDEGLLYPYELKIFEYHGGEYLTDYAFAFSRAMDMLKFAYLRIKSGHRARINEFAARNSHWLDDYALFMSVRERFGGLPFWMWPDQALARREKEAMTTALIDEQANVDFWKFSQFIFYSQWAKTKTAINSLGVRMIGDMPIYVSMDSSDVWAAPHLFKLNEDLTPRVVAGVPPDYFAVDGQLWGNPIYDWDVMEKTGFAWWISRIREALQLFDYVRIDHFRGFESYWEVDATAKTAVKGAWRKGPAMKLFDKVSEVFGDANIIAEDLGDVTDEVRQFLADSRFPGMKVLQFAFDHKLDNEYLPHNYTKNCVAYTGTHDNNTTLGWLWEAEEDDRNFALDYAGYQGSEWGRGGAGSASVYAITRTLWQSPAALAIVPMQDICGFGADARMNVPGTGTGNWRFRITGGQLAEVPAERWKRFNVTFRRFPNPAAVLKTIGSEVTEANV
ncbi:MAG: 4-alpha-glucanotransferase [Saccharofermentanales bacterium]